MLLLMKIPTQIHITQACDFQNSLPDPPNNTSVTYSGPVKEGSLVTLTCNTNSNPAANNYTWYQLDGEQGTAVGFEKMHSTTVTEARSQFYCTVSNGYGAQTSSVAHIDVLCKSSQLYTDGKCWQATWIERLLPLPVSPKETTVFVDKDGPILEGSFVTLFCKSRANPPVTNYTWYKDNEQEVCSGSVLVIEVVDSSHSGNYLCAAENELGDDLSAAYQLDIQCKFFFFFSFLSDAKLCVSSVFIG